VPGILLLGKTHDSSIAFAFSLFHTAQQLGLSVHNNKNKNKNKNNNNRQQQQPTDCKTTTNRVPVPLPVPSCHCAIVERLIVELVPLIFY